jgi:O-antigen/teichoic acid export membrane protein
MGAFGVRLVLAAATGVVLSRALNPEGRGTYNVIVTVASTATVLGHLSVMQATVEFWSTRRPVLPGNNLLLGPLLGVAAALSTGLVIALAMPGIVPAYARPMLFLALATVPIGVVTIYMTTVVVLLDRVDAVNRAMMCSALAQCAAVVAFAVAGRLSTTTVIWIWTVSGAIPLLMYAPVLRPHLRQVDLRLAWRMVGTGIRYQFGSIALLLLVRVDVLILNAFAPGSPVGLYTLAVTIGDMTYVATNALSQVVLSKQAERSLDGSAELTVRCTRVAGLMTALLLGATCVAAPWLVPVLYGTDFRSSVPVLFALAPGVLALSASRSIPPYLVRLGRPWLLSGLSMLALVVNVGLNLLFIPHWGVLGCAYASSVGWLTLAGCHVVWFCRSTGTSPAALVPGRDDLIRVWSELAAMRRGA